MKAEYSFHAAQFFTATIYEWQPILADNQHKDIIIKSLQFLVSDQRIELNAFVIMSNHIHLIWQALNDFYTLRNTSIFYEIYSTTNKATNAKK